MSFKRQLTNTGNEIRDIQTHLKRGLTGVTGTSSSPPKTASESEQRIVKIKR